MGTHPIFESDFDCLTENMAGSALKRLMAEHRQLMANPPEALVAGPKNDDNYFEWDANILGPEDTCFEYGVFKATLTFPKDYPMSPPKMRFISDICHPNVYADGRVCISILHPPGDDPMGYESATERWSPVQNVDAAKLWRDQRASFLHRAKQSVKASLNL